MIRTVLVLVALVASGIGFRKLTAGNGAVVSVVEKADSSPIADERIPARILITLSSPAGYIDLKAGGKNVPLAQDAEGRFAGNAMIAPGSQALFLKVSCSPASVGANTNFFAKLVVEAEGEKTFTHVFDAPGDIDDFVELPF